ncbi:MAG: hydantoinase/oxoprolinase N-terminal domain-containing protein, partial [Bacilli bacterium]
MRKVRIGIDVGGTFTDAIMIDNQTNEILAQDKIATSHSASEGVAKGIITLVEKIMKESNTSASDVVFIAHGTTQATNALLEGDVATVGVIGIGESKMARNELNIKDIELAPNKFLKVVNHYFSVEEFSKERIIEAVNDLINQGAQVMVVSQASGIDD